MAENLVTICGVVDRVTKLLNSTWIDKAFKCLVSRVLERTEPGHKGQQQYWTKGHLGNSGENGRFP